MIWFGISDVAVVCACVFAAGLDPAEAPVWASDEQATSCMRACGSADFGLFWRKRHCRRCGDIVCSHCMAAEPVLLDRWLSKDGSNCLASPGNKLTVLQDWVRGPDGRLRFGKSGKNFTDRWVVAQSRHRIGREAHPVCACCARAAAASTAACGVGPNASLLARLAGEWRLVSIALGALGTTWWRQAHKRLALAMLLRPPARPDRGSTARRSARHNRGIPAGIGCRHSFDVIGIGIGIGVSCRGRRRSSSSSRRRSSSRSSSSRSSSSRKRP